MAGQHSPWFAVPDPTLGADHADTARSPQPPSATNHESGPTASSEHWFDAYLFDLDGTIHLGDRLLPGAVETVARIRDRGIPVRFLSNNPTHSPATIHQRLHHLGLDLRLDEVVNTVLTTTRWLRENRPEAVVFPIAEQPVIEALRAAGQPLSDDPASIDIVLASYDRSFDYRKLQTAFDALWFHRRATLMSTNPDRFCPYPGGRGEPDAASIVAAIEACTQTTCERTFGKPSPLMLDLALHGTGVPASAAVMVGDRLATDIAMARAAGMTGVLVLTGDAGLPEVTTAPEAERPHRVIRALAELLPTA
ncbi:MAG: HAD-IIA family hydrolase [Propionicimonas sp.]